MKKVVSLTIIFVLLVMAMTGCGSKGVNDKNVDEASNKKLAKEFVQLLFSEEVQSADLNDGFVVNKAAMEELVDKDNDIVQSAGGEDYMIYAEYPTLEDRKAIYEQIKSLEGPMENDMTMIDMILDEAERYLRGDRSLH